MLQLRAPGKPTIQVMGDAYEALFYMRPGGTFLDGISFNRAFVYRLPVGVEYILQAIRAVSDPEEMLGPKDCESPGPDDGASSLFRMPLYEIIAAPQLADPSAASQLPLLRFANAQSQDITVVAPISASKCAGTQEAPTKPVDVDVLVHWFGRKTAPRKVPEEPPQCRFHIQVGLATALGSRDPEQGTKNPENMPKATQPHHFAIPTIARLLVVDISEINAGFRIRSTLSYEAVAVDLLRLLRGDRSKPNPQPMLRELSLDGHDPPELSVLLVPLSNAAVFMYACGKGFADGQSEAKPTSNGGPSPQNQFGEGAWLLCHKSECAPLSSPVLDQTIGCTGFVSPQLAVAMACWISEKGKDPLRDPEVFLLFLGSSGISWGSFIGVCRDMRVGKAGKRPCWWASPLRVATGGAASRSSDQPAPPLARQQGLSRA